MQLHIGVETIRATELLFQPSMIGSSEAGLAETVEYVLKMLNDSEQMDLANSVFLTGGCSNFVGKNRLSIHCGLYSCCPNTNIQLL